ncbi:hypothetical protein CSV69_10150 [Sporosarcina sp. P26b]|uniref:hypothetical protein n=1 Tax=Sporosarcina sp. P26b TaxID=2048253 RepID=UPI000C16B776|nr:hypothetical protein [Sporosarcina sp. P26b]PIC95692.1 hypothetical protein CSV69_10150 [Sporosarcina sp. P26b]
MKKKLKIFLLAIVALIVVGGGYLLYVFQFKEYEVADKEVEEILDNPYDIILPNGTKLVLDEEESSDSETKEQAQTSDGKKSENQQTAGVSSSNESNNKTALSDTTNGNATATDKAKDGVSQPSAKGAATAPTDQSDSSKPTGDKQTTKNPTAAKPATGNTGTGKPGKKDSVASIKQKYEPTVNNLQGQVDGKINSLISRAKNEYTTKKANGESINYAYFYNKYMSAAEGLEAQTDAVFNGVVSSLEKDLQANGYDKSYSQSIRDEYASQKKARRDSILSKAMGR